MNSKEALKILGVDENATPEVMKSAYRKLAMKHHPDKNGNSKESQAKFQQIAEAYELLTNPKPQSQYQSTGGYDNFAQEFEFHFGHGGFWSQTRRNRSYQTQVAITLEQAYAGMDLSVSLGDKVVTVELPKGAQHGQIITIEGEGSREHSDLPPGDLQIIVFIRAHDVFATNGPDLIMAQTVDAIDILTGCEVEVMTISGEKLSVTVPSGSSPNTRLRIPDRGMPVGAGYGALYIQIIPTFRKLTDEQIEYLKNMKS